MKTISLATVLTLTFISGSFATPVLTFTSNGVGFPGSSITVTMTLSGIANVVGADIWLDTTAPSGTFRVTGFAPGSVDGSPASHIAYPVALPDVSGAANFGFLGSTAVSGSVNLGTLTIECLNSATAGTYTISSAHCDFFDSNFVEYSPGGDHRIDVVPASIWVDVYNPEPTTLVLLSLGGLFLRKRRVGFLTHHILVSSNQSIAGRLACCRRVTGHTA